MKKRIIIAAAFAACLALCAAVWPQNKPLEETHPHYPYRPLYPPQSPKFQRFLKS